MTQQPATTGTVPTWTITDRFRKAREHAGLSQQELADAIGVSRQTVSNYEGGMRPHPRTVADWARVCKVDWRWVVSGGAGRPPDDTPEGKLWQQLAPHKYCLHYGEFSQVRPRVVMPLAA